MLTYLNNNLLKKSSEKIVSSLYTNYDSNSNAYIWVNSKKMLKEFNEIRCWRRHVWINCGTHRGVNTQRYNRSVSVKWSSQSEIIRLTGCRMAAHIESDEQHEGWESVCFWKVTRAFFFDRQVEMAQTVGTDVKEAAKFHLCRQCLKIEDMGSSESISWWCIDVPFQCTLVFGYHRSIECACQSYEPVYLSVSLKMKWMQTNKKKIPSHQFFFGILLPLLT